jgi:PAS domain S-box-containing protein
MINESPKESLIVQEKPNATDMPVLGPPLSEKEVVEMMNQLDIILKNLRCGFNVVREDHTIKYQNQFLRERFGDLQNIPCYNGYLNLTQPCEGCPLGKQPSGVTSKTMEVKAKDGKSYRISLIPVRSDDGCSDTLEVFQEIGPEKGNQEKINFLAGIVNHTPESVIATDQEGRIKYVNPGTEKMFGYPAKELLDQELEILTTELYKERIQNEIYKTAASGRVWTGELLNRRKDGKLFYVSTSVSKMADREGNFIALVWFQRDITQTKRYQEEMIKIEQEKAETLRILHENETAINRSLNKAKRELQEKNLELEKRTHELEGEKKRLKEAYEKLNQIQAQLIQSEKLASLGQLSAGVAHELNNPIGFVHSNLGTLDEYVQDLKKLLTEYVELEQRMSAHGQCAEPLRQIRELKRNIGLDHILEDFDKLINESKEGTSRVKNIVQNLKNFSYMDKGELQLADLNQGIESTLSIVHNELKYRAEVIKEYGSLPQIACFPQQLNQVFMNLLVNAAQAIETKGTIRIKTYQRGTEVVVEISDDGVGIPKENLKHIFEPFFTTKEVGKGTGLGLSVVYGIIQNHKGKIEVESGIKKGSTFRVILPLNPLAINEKIIGSSRV